MMQMTPTVKQLLIINVILFIGAQLVPVVNLYFPLYFFENPGFRFWQPITHMFMHGSVSHIFFNMFALISFGSTLEHFWGPKKFLFFYFSCGLGAALLQSLAYYYSFHSGVDLLIAAGETKEQIYGLLGQGKINLQWQSILGADFQSFIESFTARAVGASGAIYGLLAAFAIMFPNAELALMFIPVPIKAKYFVPIMVALDLFSGISGSSFLGGNIAHFAHVGGAVFGALMVWYWKKTQFDNNRWM